MGIITGRGLDGMGLTVPQPLLDVAPKIILGLSALSALLGVGTRSIEARRLWKSRKRARRSRRRARR
jgi:hypothetical protein